jgi:hypothetical protein
VSLCISHLAKTQQKDEQQEDYNKCNGEYDPDDRACAKAAASSGGFCNVSKLTDASNGIYLNNSVVIGGRDMDSLWEWRYTCHGCRG